MSAYITLLIQADGFSSPNDKNSLEELFGEFTAGTERRKNSHQLTVNKELGGPVRNLYNISFKWGAVNCTRNFGVSTEMVSKKIKVSTTIHNKGETVVLIDMTLWLKMNVTLIYYYSLQKRKNFLLFCNYCLPFSYDLLK